MYSTLLLLLIIYSHVKYVCVCSLCVLRVTEKPQQNPCVFAHTRRIKAQSDQCNVKYYFPNKQPNKQFYIHKMCHVW